MGFWSKIVIWRVVGGGGNRQTDTHTHQWSGGGGGWLLGGFVKGEGERGRERKEGKGRRERKKVVVVVVGERAATVGAQSLLHSGFKIPFIVSSVLCPFLLFNLPCICSKFFPDAKSLFVLLRHSIPHRTHGTNLSRDARTHCLHLVVPLNSEDLSSTFVATFRVARLTWYTLKLWFGVGCRDRPKSWCNAGPARM